MRIKMLVTVGAVIGCVSLGTVPASAEVREYPNVNVVAVQEIDTDWVKISAFDTFNVDNSSHIDQAYDLADFACALYNREEVMLSFFGNVADNGLVFPNAYYLFACALP